MTPTLTVTPERESPALAPPPGNPKFALLDACRGLAALAVVAFHAAQLSGRDTVVGRALIHLDVGVTVFFLLTGFLLFRPMVASLQGDAPPVGVRRFYRRRVLRIVPAYWAALLVLAPLLVFAPPLGLPNVLFLQVYEASWARTGIAPAWSVCVEVSFYLLLPLFALAVRGVLTRGAPEQRVLRMLGLLAALLVASIALRSVAYAAGVPLYLLDVLPGTLHWFALGMALAVVSAIDSPTSRRIRGWFTRSPAACWAGAAALYGIAVVATAEEVHGTPYLPATYGVIAVLLLGPAVFCGASALPARALGHRWLAWLGLVSYGIYLYHYPLMIELRDQAGLAPSDTAVLWLALAGAAVATACGAASYYLLERRVLRFKG